MKNGQDLTVNEKEVIRYFTTPKLWHGDTCKVSRSGLACPNANLQDCKNHSGLEYICHRLVRKLGLAIPDQDYILERELQKIVLDSMPLIDWALGEEVKYYAREYQTEVGRPDILLTGDDTRTLYVVEMKSGIATREHVGQLMAYVGWFKTKPLPKDLLNVKGILLAKDFDSGARYAISGQSDLYARTYDLHVTVKIPPWNEPG